MSGSRASGDVCGSKTDPWGPRAYRTAFVIPARATFFFPKPLHAQQWERSPRSARSPWFFFFTRCWWVYFNFLFPGLWVIISLFTEDKKQPSCVSVVGTLLLVFPARGGTGLSSLAVWFFLCVFFFFWASTVTKTERVSLVSGCGHVVRYVVCVRLMLWTRRTGLAFRRSRALLQCLLSAPFSSHFCSVAGSWDVPEPGSA